MPSHCLSSYCGIVLEREILALFLNKPMRKSISNMSH